MNDRHCHDLCPKQVPTEAHLADVAAILLGDDGNLKASTVKGVIEYMKRVGCTWVATINHVRALQRKICSEKITPSSIPLGPWANLPTELNFDDSDVSDCALFLVGLMVQPGVAFVVQVVATQTRNGDTAGTVDNCVTAPITYTLLRRFGGSCARVIDEAGFEAAHIENDIGNICVDPLFDDMPVSAAGRKRRHEWLVNEARRVSQELTDIVQSDDIRIEHVAWMHPINWRSSHGFRNV